MAADMGITAEDSTDGAYGYGRFGYGFGLDLDSATDMAGHIIGGYPYYGYGYGYDPYFYGASYAYPAASYDYSPYDYSYAPAPTYNYGNAPPAAPQPQLWLRKPWLRSRALRTAIRYI